MGILVMPDLRGQSIIDPLRGVSTILSYNGFRKILDSLSPKSFGTFADELSDAVLSVSQNISENFPLTAWKICTYALLGSLPDTFQKTVHGAVKISPPTNHPAEGR